MHLRVGLIGDHPGWKLLLDQEGVPYSLNVSNITPDHWSVLILAGNIPPETLTGTREFLYSGGALICSAIHYDQMFGSRSQTRFLKYIVPDDNSIFTGIGSIDIHRKCSIIPQANELLDEKNCRSVYIGEVGGGHVVVLPFDAGDMMLDHRVARKSFYGNIRRLPFEIVSLVSKGRIRKLVSRSLEVLYHRRRLPYVHRWYFPRNELSLFVLRIDTDYASRQEIASLHSFLSHNQTEHHRKVVPATWFIDVQSQEQWLDDFQKMDEDEVGVHCFDHKFYKNYQESLDDIQRALHVFAKRSLRVKGFASAYGQWNPDTGKAIGSSGFEYSSEFSYDYDDFPSYPVVEGMKSSVLQIPVHPVSIGTLRRLGLTIDEIIKYFHHVIASKLNAREPIAVYHHPRDGHEGALQEMFTIAEQHHLQAVRMTDYANWWKERAGGECAVEAEGSSLQVTSNEISQNTWMHITRHDGLEAFTPVQSLVDLSSLSWKPVPQQAPLPADYARMYKFNPWVPIIQAENLFSKIVHSR